MEEIKTRLTNGAIATRLVAAIYAKMSIRQIMFLREKNILLPTANDFLDWHNLRYECFDDVLMLTDTPAARIIFDAESAPIQEYSDHDVEVIEALDILSKDELDKVEEFIYFFYPAIQWESKVVNASPTERFLAYLDSRKREGTNRETKEQFFREGHTSQEAIDEFLRFKSLGPRGKFRTDPLVDIARGLGISIHWLFGMKSPLFCKELQAERIFDLYTLMPKSRQDILCKILQHLQMKE